MEEAEYKASHDFDVDITVQVLVWCLAWGNGWAYPRLNTGKQCLN